MPLKIPHFSTFYLEIKTTDGETEFHNLDSSTIPENAFHGRTDIVSVSIPETVTYIERNAFLGCTNLKSIEVEVPEKGILCFISSIVFIRHYAADESFIQDLVTEGYAADLRNNEIYFDSDDDFTDFCIAPYASFKKLKDGNYTISGAYSDMYKNYVEQGISFIIRDRNSKVFERQCVNKRVPVKIGDEPIIMTDNRLTMVQLSVQNLKDYWMSREYFDNSRRSRAMKGSDETQG